MTRAEVVPDMKKIRHDEQKTKLKVIDGIESAEQMTKENKWLREVQESCGGNSVADGKAELPEADFFQGFKRECVTSKHRSRDAAPQARE